ncbi:unannotated protein [freshwater metagenome]|uniref:Unannotated protein n=1 Tax=freshwater metagenome TaxID=449393 RepID=A0A6J7K0T4_9ZZZZ
MEPREFFRSSCIGPDHKVVAVAINCEVAVDDLRNQHVGSFCLGKLRSKHRANAVLELFVGFSDTVICFGTELPLIAEQSGFVDVGRDVVDRDALDDLGAEERGSEDLVVDSDVR